MGRTASSPPDGGRWRRRVTSAVATTTLVLAGCTDDGSDGGDASAPPAGSTAEQERTTAPATVAPTATTLHAGSRCATAVPACTLAEAGRAIGVRVGVALSSGQLGDPAIVELVRREFTQITPENELKWTEVERAEGVFDFAGADALVDFAAANGLEVRGHTLIWGQRQGNGTPAWARELSDPARLESAMRRWIETSVARYRGRVARWDVVNEPLDHRGSSLDGNPFLTALGERYLDIAFAQAAAADPGAELWLNEVGAENDPVRADALVALVSRLRARGVPLDGVGLQGHLDANEPLRDGQLRSVVRRLRGLGVEVALTEVDVATRTDVADPFDVQADVFGQLAAECLDGGCTEIGFWGIGDGFSWLDGVLQRQADPLLFDRSLRAKPAYEAVRRVLADR